MILATTMLDLMGLRADEAQALDVAETARRATDRAEADGHPDVAEFKGFERAAIGEALALRDRLLNGLARAVLNQALRERLEAWQLESEAAAEEAARKAAAIWTAARPAPLDHPYLVAKAVAPAGLRVDRHGNLLVPVVDIHGHMQSLQLIAPSGEKKFLRGGRVAGGFHLLGEPADALVVCEGLATGLSLHEDSGLPVAVAFSATNLLPVAVALRKRYPKAVLVLAADDDWKSKDNPGRTQAEAAARAVGGRVLVPDFTGLNREAEDTDFNDLLSLLNATEARA
ncbi:toprim domain-containing protein [Variovorax sp. OV329]|uniref:toprim domain-containing protein n=1 Tax=Variovorax sp. OV329 TaxID=1882825 RepID=UPI0008E7048F|nr:toprim domain-containing protein [Variovorax sp. OV329]SFL87421.1 putative DNA primase/helicase [Variovorax sp. OV329]